MTADDTYSLLNCDNLAHPIQRQLSTKQKFISDFVSAFLNYRCNFKHFEKKDDPLTWCISQVTVCERRC